jgi:simple sugar transport system permease protein
MMVAEILTTAIIVNIIASTIRISTPILIAALGELVTERAGIMNLGVEGTMLMGAFTGFLVTFRTGSLLFGTGAAIVVGGLMGLIMAFMAATLKVDQTITGLGLNLLGAGLSLFWYRIGFENIGGDTSPIIETSKIVKIPLLSEIPYLGDIFFSHQVLTYIAFLMVPIIWFFLYRTKYGLRIRGLGENPMAVDMKGVKVARLVYFATIFGGMMAGLGGSFVTIGTTVRFLPGITGGRGWLAVVIVIAGNWRPWRILVATLIFAFLDALQLQIQGIGVQIPFQILLALPYIIAVVVLLGGRASSKPPRYLGRTYYRE